MRIESLFTSPGLDNREMVGAHGALQNIELQIAFVFAAVFSQSPEQT